MRTVLIRADAWMFGAVVDPSRLRRVRVGLAVVIGMRVALGPYTALAGQPATLFRPVPVVALLPSMPPVAVVVALQVLGVAAAVAAAAGLRRRLAFAVAWACLLVLAALRSSLGKVLHNDVLLLLASAPFLLAPAEPGPGGRPGRPAPGWPLQAALVVTAGAYFFAGYHKLVASGLAWVGSDNMRNIAYGALLDGRAPLRWPAQFVATHPWAATATAVFILALELSFPVVLAAPGLRPVYAAAATVLHAATWAALGLDYWAWVAVVVLVLPDWSRRPAPDPSDRRPVPV